jgi:hypothetical protein
MKPVLKKEESIHYISDAEMIEFISENAPMDWNECCKFVRNNNIVGSEGRVYWIKSHLDNIKPGNYSEEQIKWVGAFFKAHPWIERMMIVFDN